MSKSYIRSVRGKIRLHRNLTVVTTSLAILAAIAFTLSSLGANPYERRHSMKGQPSLATASRAAQATAGSAQSSSATHEIFATFFLAGEQFTSKILIYNVRNDASITVNLNPA